MVSDLRGSRGILYDLGLVLYTTITRAEGGFLRGFLWLCSIRQSQCLEDDNYILFNLVLKFQVEQASIRQLDMSTDTLRNNIIFITSTYYRKNPPLCHATTLQLSFSSLCGLSLFCFGLLLGTSVFFSSATVALLLQRLADLVFHGISRFLCSILLHFVYGLLVTMVQWREAPSWQLGGIIMLAAEL